MAPLDESGQLSVVHEIRRTDVWKRTADIVLCKHNTSF